MREIERQAVFVLLSGGIDSAACAKFYLSLGHDVHAIHVDYGQPARLAERKSVAAIVDHYGIDLHCVSLIGVATPSRGEIVGRNSMLLSVALMFIGKTTSLVSIGIHAGTPYFDCQPAFVRLWEALLSGYSDGRAQLSVPFLSWTKPAIWQYCTENNVPVHLTWSCEASAISPCGTCSSCRDRERLLAGA